MKAKKRHIIGKIPYGKWGANVICDNGDCGFIHHGQIDHTGNYYVYPYRDEFKIEAREFKVKSYF